MIEAEVCTRKELLWLACKEKRCCSAYLVPLTGIDVWRISRTMQIPPYAFTFYTDALPEADGFALDTSDKRYELVLARHRDPIGDRSTCVFLWRLPDGHAQCGLGHQRPNVCQTYPFTLVDGILCVDDCNECTCRTWGLSQIDSKKVKQQLQTQQQERETYREILNSWNERVQADGRGRSYLEFCDYLVSAYADRFADADEAGH
jgi:Fe-S-cluster containining protein